METTESQTLGLHTALLVVRRRLWVILTCFGVTLLAAFAVSNLQTPKYTATASLLFSAQPANIAQEASGLQPVSANDPTGQRATNLALVELNNAVSQRAAVALRAGITPSQVRDAVTAVGDSVSNVVSVSATWTSATLAARIANAFTAAFIQQQTAQAQATVQSGITAINRQLATLSPAERAGVQGQTLLDHLDSLRTFKVMQSDAQILQPATVPTSASSPNIPRNTVLGAVLGLLLGLGLAFLFDRLDQRVRDPQTAEASLGVPVLGVVPHAASGDLAVGAERRGALVDLERFRGLRTHLQYFNVDRELKVLLVVSPHPSEGKTTVARNLATAAASMGNRALLIEADLRRPTLALSLHLTKTVGLANVLVGQVAAEDAVQRVVVDGWTNGSGHERHLDILLAGAIPPNPAELLESRAMADLLGWAASTYQLVVVDTAPLSVVADAVPLTKSSDGVIIVSRLGVTTRGSLGRLRSLLENLNAPTLGVVVNDAAKREIEDYGYYGGSALPKMSGSAD